MKIGILIPTRERPNLQLTLISSIITTVNDMSGNTILIDISYNPLLRYQIEILYLNNTSEKLIK